MKELEEILNLIEQLRGIERRKIDIRKDHYDFNKENRIQQLEHEAKGILDIIASKIDSDSFSFLHVEGKPDASLCDVFLNEVNVLKSVKERLTIQNFPQGYIKGNAKHDDQRYQDTIKPIDDYIDRYNDMYKFTALLNAPNDKFVEAMEVMYDRKVSFDDADTIDGRLKILSETEMINTIPLFYNATTLLNKMEDLLMSNAVNSNYIQTLRSEIIGYTIKPTLGINNNDVKRVVFDDLLNELQLLFSGNSHGNDHYDFRTINRLGSYEAGKLYEILETYCRLYEETVKGEKISEALNVVKNDPELTLLKNHYESLPTTLLKEDEKKKLLAEREELKKSKNPFNKQSRANRIEDLDRTLTSDQETIKTLNNSDTDIFNKYFAAISDEATCRGIKPEHFANKTTWEALKQSIKTEIESMMAHAAIDGHSLKYSTIINEVLFPFEIYVSKNKERVDQFIRENNIKVDLKNDIDINKVLAYLELYKNSQLLHNGTDARTTTPYNRDLANYFTTKSWMNVTGAYQESMSKEEKTIATI